MTTQQTGTAQDLEAQAVTAQSPNGQPVNDQSPNPQPVSGRKLDPRRFAGLTPLKSLRLITSQAEAGNCGVESPDSPPRPEREYSVNIPPLGDVKNAPCDVAEKTPDAALPVECGGADPAVARVRTDQPQRPDDQPQAEAQAGSPGEQPDRPAGFFADERQSYQGQMTLSQGQAAADGMRAEEPKRGLRPRTPHEQPPIAAEGGPADSKQEPEMSEDMLNLMRASTPPPPNEPINSVEDLLEVVHLLPVVELFRRMKHLKASRIRRMFDSRKFREHMDLRRRLAWEKATTEAAVTSPAAVDRLYRLTMCGKPETARKACMTLLRLGRPETVGPETGRP